MSRAIDERTGRDPPSDPHRAAPVGYVAGEATAAVNYINTGDARPTTTPPRVSERGVGRPPDARPERGEPRLRGPHRPVRRGLVPVGRPARCRGARPWSRVTGAVRDQGVREIELGTTVGEVAAEAGARAAGIQAVVLGGYFGTWAPSATAWGLPLDPAVMKRPA